MLTKDARCFLSDSPHSHYYDSLLNNSSTRASERLGTSEDPIIVSSESEAEDDRLTAGEDVNRRSFLSSQESDYDLSKCPSPRAPADEDLTVYTPTECSIGSPEPIIGYDDGVPSCPRLGLDLESLPVFDRVSQDLIEGSGVYSPVHHEVLPPSEPTYLVASSLPHHLSAPPGYDPSAPLAHQALLAHWLQSAQTDVDNELVVLRRRIASQLALRTQNGAWHRAALMAVRPLIEAGYALLGTDGYELFLQAPDFGVYKLVVDRPPVRFPGQVQLPLPFRPSH